MSRNTALILAAVGLAAGVAWWWMRRKSVPVPGLMIPGATRTTLPGLAPTSAELREIAANPQLRTGHNRF